MPKKAGFFKDILFFEKEFDGVMPLEIMIDTKRKKGVMKLSTLKKMDEVQEIISEIPELVQTHVGCKCCKIFQTSLLQPQSGLLRIANGTGAKFHFNLCQKCTTKHSEENFMKSYVDSTGQYARITTFMKDIGTDKMEKIEEKLWDKINKVFPPENTP
jgi:uncharacterized protein